MRQPLEMILSFRLEVAAYCIVVVEHTTVMQTQKHMYRLMRFMLACMCNCKNAHARAFMYLHSTLHSVTPL